MNPNQGMLRQQEASMAAMRRQAFMLLSWWACGLTQVTCLISPLTEHQPDSVFWDGTGAGRSAAPPANGRRKTRRPRRASSWAVTPRLSIALLLQTGGVSVGGNTAAIVRWAEQRIALGAGSETTAGVRLWLTSPQERLTSLSSLLPTRRGLQLLLWTICGDADKRSGSQTKLDFADGCCTELLFSQKTHRWIFSL